MLAAEAKLDGDLFDWNSMKDTYDWSGILIGNGASIAIWNHFSYSSIFSKSATDEIKHPLLEKDQNLFNALGTTNFEQVLSSLSTAKTINQVLGFDVDLIDGLYTNIQRALIEAVRTIHIPWKSVPDRVLEAINSELLRYKYVYSTNYDLLIYWAMMHQNQRAFRDFFFSEAFDLSNTEIWSKPTAVLFLHGGLHLYRLPSGQTLKRRAENDKNLLDLFGQPYYEGAVPLFITEGSHEEKMASIYKSDYLSFAYNKFSQHRNSLVIFGHSLSERDKHIVDAINNWGPARIAISMLPDTASNVRRKKAQIVSQLPDAKLYFFDATTHPLGTKELKIEQ